MIILKLIAADGAAVVTNTERFSQTLAARPSDARLVWHATRPASLAPYADVAGAFAQIASLALGAVAERDNLSRAVAARHRVGTRVKRRFAYRPIRVAFGAGDSCG